MEAERSSACLVRRTSEIPLSLSRPWLERGQGDTWTGGPSLLLRPDGDQLEVSVGALADPVVGDLSVVAFWEALLEMNVHPVTVCLDLEGISVGDLGWLGGVDLLQEARRAVPWSLPAADVAVAGTSSLSEVVESLVLKCPWSFQKEFSCETLGGAELETLGSRL